LKVAKAKEKVRWYKLTHVLDLLQQTNW
jgi:hypothetical protein